MRGKQKEKLFRIYRPNTGLQLRPESVEEIRQKYRKALPDTAKAYWIDQYEASHTVCSHAYWRGNCRKVGFGSVCEIGLRSRTYHVLSGSVLGCWTKVESVLASLPGGHATRMQIIRLKTDDDLRIVGAMIPDQALIPLTTLLSSQTPLEEPVRMQQIMPSRIHQSMSHSNLANLARRGTPSPTLLLDSPYIPKVASAASISRTSTMLQHSRSSPILYNQSVLNHPSPIIPKLNNTVSKIAAPIALPQFRLTSASAKTSAFSPQIIKTTSTTPVPNTASAAVSVPSIPRTVMEAPEEHLDMPAFL